MPQERRRCLTQGAARWTMRKPTLAARVRPNRAMADSIGTNGSPVRS